MEHHHHSYEIHIRTKDARQLTEGFTTDMQVELTAGIRREPNTMFHVTLSSVEFPWTFYNFSSNLNNLQLHLDSGSTVFTLAAGNYNIYELVTAINDDGSFPYTASYDVNSSKITLTNSDSTAYTLSFGDADSINLAKALGFKGQDYSVAAGGAQTGENCVNLQTIHSIFLHSKDLAVGNVITTQSGNYEKILKKIPLVNSAPGSIIEYGPWQTSPFSARVQANEIKNFSLSFKDQNGNLIDTNGVNFELTLLIELWEHQELMEGTRQAKGIGHKRARIYDNHHTTRFTRTRAPVPEELTHGNEDAKMYHDPIVDPIVVVEPPETPEYAQEELDAMDRQEADVNEMILNLAGVDLPDEDQNL